MLTGCSRQVSPVSKNTKELFQYLGFDDKSNDGIIEKNIFWWASWLDEGYKEEVDIDGDGKLIGAEIRFYLHALQISSDKEGEKQTLEKMKQQNPIDSEDRSTLSGLFLKKTDKIKTIESQEDQSEALSNLALEIARAGLFKEAIEIAKTIKVSSSENVSLTLGFAEYYGNLKVIRDSEYRSTAFGDIALEMVKAGSDKNEVSKVFQLAIDASKTNYYDENNNIIHTDTNKVLFNNVLAKMAKAGIGKTEPEKPVLLTPNKSPIIKPLDTPSEHKKPPIIKIIPSG